LKNYARRIDAAEQVTRALSAGTQSPPVLAS
jgi:hypothetical protein